MRLVLSFQYPRLCIWYQQYWPRKLRQKDVRQLSRKKKKREPRFSRQSSFQKFDKILHNEGILSRIPSILRNSLFESKPRID